MFTGSIRPHSARRNPLHRGRDYEMTIIGFYHRRKERMDHVDDTESVDIEHPAPFLNGYLPHRQFAGPMTGIRAYDIHLPHTLEARIARFVDRSGVCGINFQCEYPVPVLMEVVAGLCQCVRVDVQQGYSRAPAEECLRHSAAYATCPAGNDGAPAR